MNRRLLRIEIRRTIGVWMFPIVAAVAAKFAYDVLHYQDVRIWATSSKAVRDAVFTIGPFAAGATAWIAGQEGRRGLGDLLATTPRPELHRRLGTWTATVVWGVMAYLGVGAFVVADSLLHQAWGTLTLWPMLTGVLAVLSHAALGYAFGYVLPRRFTAPLVGITALAVQTFVADQVAWGWWQWLSPVSRLKTSVWYDVHPDLSVAQTLFLLGLFGLGWGASALRSGKRRAGESILTGAMALTALGVGETYRRAPAEAAAHGGGLAQGERKQLIPYTPVCSNDRLAVCVHPAYQSQLPEVATLINRMAEPLLGIPGAPTKAEQQPFPAHGDVFTFDLRNRISPLTAYTLALKLVRDEGLPSHDPGEAQMVLQIWLMERVGVEITCVNGAHAQGEFVTFVYEQRVCDAAGRFASLAPDVQRTWLTEHYIDLHADQLRLEDLP